MVYITPYNATGFNALGGEHTHTYQWANQNNFKKPGTPVFKGNVDCNNK